MLPRTKTIFHVGEEEDDDDDAIREVKSSKQGQPTRTLVVGLQILIQQHNQEPNIITKHTMKPPRASHGSPKLGFLRACYLCKRELNPQMDVYMYRGEHGFCTDECRSRQMMLDENREFQASFGGHQRVANYYQIKRKTRNLNCHSRISTAA